MNHYFMNMLASVSRMVWTLSLAVFVAIHCACSTMQVTPKQLPSMVSELDFWAWGERPMLETRIEFQSKHVDVSSLSSWLKVQRSDSRIAISADAAPLMTGLYLSEAQIQYHETRFLVPVRLRVLKPGVDGAKRKVLFIGIDGVRGDVAQKVDLPNLRQIRRAGLGSFQAKIQTKAPAISGPGWTSILTGVEPTKHLVRNNESIELRDVRYPSLFEFCVRGRLDFSAAVAWEPLRALIPKSNLSKVFSGNDLEVVTWLKSQLAQEQTDVFFIHLDDVDHEGHTTGFSAKNEKYLSALMKVDRTVGDLIDAVLTRPNISQEDWLFVVTSDHGGLGLEHGNRDMENTHTILMMASNSKTRFPVYDEGSLSHLDVIPSILSFINSKDSADNTFDGRSLLH